MAPLNSWTQPGVLLLMAGVVISTTAGAVEPQLLSATPAVAVTAEGSVQISAEGFLEEQLVLPDVLAATLLASNHGEDIRLVHWPVAPGDRRDVVVRRSSVYGPETRVFEVGEHGVREVPRSPRMHFVGEIEEEPGSGVLVILDPRDGRVMGMSISGGRTFDLEPVRGGPPSKIRVFATEERTAGNDAHWGCGGDSLDQDVWSPATPTSSFTAAEKSGSSLEAVLAVDTDTELLSQKFGNNTSAAADYVADLIAAMNVMYSRDLDVTLVQGTTYLRTGSDPYSANSGGGASSSELYEFGNYWKSNYSSVQRALAAMLSGKSPSSYSASGIAWVGGLCSSNYGYSFSKVFKANYLASDAKLVGHEIGHNFGSPHTHCYNPPVDQCYNQSGCYSGATSCPGGAGSVMSYCHITGCGSTLDFHPTVINYVLSNHVGPATGVCISEAAQVGEDIFTDSFENGTGPWSSAVQ